MKKLIQNLTTEMLKEYDRACNEFPMFASNHEAYAVIKEELEEVTIDFTVCQKTLDRIWENVKSNIDDANAKEEIKKMQKMALHMAAESIQVSAMAHKMLKSWEDRCS